MPFPLDLGAPVIFLTPFTSLNRRKYTFKCLNLNENLSDSHSYLIDFNEFLLISAGPLPRLWRKLEILVRGAVMQGDSRMVEFLNKVLTCELTSINQYFLHARIFRNWGLEELNEKEYKKSIRDMKQADVLIERILFLEGLPNLQQIDKLRIGEHVTEMLECDMELELWEIEHLREAIAYSESVQDFVSRDILVEILEQEESYVDWLETQQSLIGSIGPENYLQSQIG